LAGLTAREGEIWRPADDVCSSIRHCHEHCSAGIGWRESFGAQGLGKGRLSL